MEEEVRILRDFLLGVETLAKFEPILRDPFLANFALGKKGDVEKAKKALENYLQVRTQKFPEILLSTLPIRTRLCDIKNYRLLSNPDQDGNLVFIVRFSKWELLPGLQETADDLVREIGTLLDTLMHVGSVQCKRGVVVVFDTRGYTYQQLRVMTLANIKRTLSICLAYPLRVKAAHFIIDSIVIKSILSLIVPWLPKKISKRVKLHRNFDTVMEYIPSSILPTELGGGVEDESCYDLEIIRKMEGMQEYFSGFCKALTLERFDACQRVLKSPIK